MVAVCWPARRVGQWAARLRTTPTRMCSASGPPFHVRACLTPASSNLEGVEVEVFAHGREGERVHQLGKSVSQSDVSGYKSGGRLDLPPAVEMGQ